MLSTSATEEPLRINTRLGGFVNVSLRPQLVSVSG